MISKTIEFIAKEVIKITTKKRWKGLQREHRTLALLRKLGISKLEKDFDSLYAHALVDYGIDKSPSALVILFALNDVKEAFKNDLYNELGEFLRALEHNLHTNKNLIELKDNFSTINDLEPEIIEFKSKYSSYQSKAVEPGILALFNETKQSIYSLIEINIKNSFSYQVDKYLKTQVDFFKTEFLKEDLYIPLNGEIRIKKTERDESRDDNEISRNNAEFITEVIAYKPLDKYINQWLKDETKNLLIILGEYGTGKTTFMQFVTYQLALARMDEENHNTGLIKDEKLRIPLFLPLRNFEKTITNFVVAQCSAYGITAMNYQDFLGYVAESELVVIFDGFDEMTQRVDASERRKNFTQIRTILDQNSKSKIILTCREEYFQSEDDIRELFKENPTYAFVHLHKFTDEQIKEYLTKSPRIENADLIWDKIQGTFDLHDLATRPVLLEMIVKYLPKIIQEVGENEKIRASDIYKTCINEELERKEGELSFAIPGKDRLEILKRIAAWLFENDTLVFDTRLLDEQLQLSQFFQTKTRWEYEKFLSEFLTFTFLIREGNFEFRISHKSFRDYLTALVWSKELENKKPIQFSKTKATTELLQFILEQNLDTEYLMKLVTNSNAKTLNSNIEYQGTNAANLLVKVDPKIFVAQDLTDCILRELDFGSADLTDTTFSNTVLDEGVFNSTIINANLKDGCTFSKVALNLSFHNYNSTHYKLRKFRNLSVLHLNHANIVDLSPISNLTSLLELYLDNTKVEDLNPISNLTNLSKLYLNNTKVEDLNPISNLTNLSELYLNNTKVEDLNPISNLTNLSELYLNNTKVEDLNPISNLDLNELAIERTPIVFIKPISGYQNLTRLDLDYSSIADIEHISNFKALTLTTLYIPGVKLTSLEILTQFINLTTLWVNYTEIVDLSPIPNLVNLSHLRLNNTKVEDINPISNLTNLSELYLNDTKIVDINPISNLTNLSQLRLDNTKVEDINPISNLTNLSLLRLDNTKVEDINPISNLTNLSLLRLDNTKVEDINPISNLTNLSELYLNDTKIVDINPISNLTNLSLLRLDNTKVEDINPISNLTNLSLLRLDNTKVEDINPISNLTNLSELYLNDTKIVDINPISNLTNLSLLRLDNTKVEDINPISNLTNLSQLRLDNTKVEDINPISNLTNLSVLYLNNTKIEDLNPISNLTNLSELYLNDMKIVDINSISNLTNLSVLYLNNTEIEDLSPISNLTSLSQLVIDVVKIESDAVKKLKHLMPNLNIEQLEEK